MTLDEDSISTTLSEFIIFLLIYCIPVVHSKATVYILFTVEVLAVFVRERFFLVNYKKTDMGGDGGSIPKRDDLVRTRGKQEQVRCFVWLVRSWLVSATANVLTLSWYPLWLIALSYLIVFLLF